MRGVGLRRSGYAASVMQTVTGPWSCQLLHTEECAGGRILDLVALDACPFAEVDVATGAPFTMQFVHDEADKCGELLDDWSSSLAVLSIRILRSPPRRWLSVSGNGRHLVVELPSSGGP